MKKFRGTKATLSFAVLSYITGVLVRRHLGWRERVNATTLRFRLFTIGGIISETSGRTTLRLSVPPPRTRLVAGGAGENPRCLIKPECSEPPRTLKGWKNAASPPPSPLRPLALTRSSTPLMTVLAPARKPPNRFVRRLAALWSKIAKNHIATESLTLRH